MALLLQIISAFLIGSIIFYWRGAMGVGGFLNAQYINRLRKYELTFQKYSRILTNQTKTRDEQLMPLRFENDRKKVKEKYKFNVILNYLFGLSVIILLVFFVLLTGNQDENQTVLLSVKILFGFFIIVALLITMFVAHVSMAIMERLDARFDKLEKEIDDLMNPQTIKLNRKSINLIL